MRLDLAAQRTEGIIRHADSIGKKRFSLTPAAFLW
jgi:hypothetical protein